MAQLLGPQAGWLAGLPSVEIEVKIGLVRLTGQRSGTAAAGKRVGLAKHPLDRSGGGSAALAIEGMIHSTVESPPQGCTELGKGPRSVDVVLKLPAARCWF
jgi:hypothetical protein